jgi:hypothetical protein
VAEQARLRICEGCLAAEQQALVHVERLLYLDNLDEWHDWRDCYYGYDASGDEPEYWAMYDVASKRLEA